MERAVERKEGGAAGEGECSAGAGKCGGVERAGIPQYEKCRTPVEGEGGIRLLGEGVPAVQGMLEEMLPGLIDAAALYGGDAGEDIRLLDRGVDMEEGSAVIGMEGERCGAVGVDEAPLGSGEGGSGGSGEFWLYVGE